MVLQHRPDAAEIVGVDVLDPEHRVRIADVGDRRRVQDRLVDRPDLQLDGARVVERLGQRDVAPAEPRRAHVDGDAVDAGDARRRARRPWSRTSGPCAPSAPPPASRCSACRCRTPRPPSRRYCRCARRPRCRRPWRSCSTIIWSKCEAGRAAMARASAALEHAAGCRANRRPRSRCRGRSSCGRECR